MFLVAVYGQKLKEKYQGEATVFGEKFHRRKARHNGPEKPIYEGK